MLIIQSICLKQQQKMFNSKSHSTNQLLAIQTDKVLRSADGAKMRVRKDEAQSASQVCNMKKKPARDIMLLAAEQEAPTASAGALRRSQNSSTPAGVTSVIRTMTSVGMLESVAELTSICKQRRPLRVAVSGNKLLPFMQQPRKAAVIACSRHRPGLYATALLLAASLGCCCIFMPTMHCQTTGADSELPSTTAAQTASTVPPTTTATGGSQKDEQPSAAGVATSTSEILGEMGPEFGGSASNASSGASKLKPVNFTLVDEIFEATLSDDEVVRRWKVMDSRFQDGIKSILKMVFPQIVAISQDAKVSGDCSGGILKWILSLRNLRSWAIKMLDATGKPTAGIFQGSLTMFGNYRQCLNIRAPDEDEIEITDQFEEYFRGQFCVLHLKPWLPAKRPFYQLNSAIEPLIRKNYKYYEKTLYDELAEIAIAFNFIDIRMDLCVPSTCTVADIQRVAELLSKKLEMRAKVMRCDTAPRDTSLFAGLDRASFMWMCVPLALIFLSFSSTILISLVRSRRTSRSTRTSNGRSNVNGFAGANRQGSGESKFEVVLQCLSLGGALRDRLSRSGLLTGDTGEEDSETESPGAQMDAGEQQMLLARKPLPLYGLRSLFVLWFIVVQMTVELKYQYLRESLILRDMMITYWPFQIIINSSLLFESLILITAFTYSYTCLEATFKDLIGYIVDKYIRLVLSILTLTALTIVTPLMAIGSPVWRNFVEEQANVCKANGYINSFFLQNFIAYDKICLPHTWLFCVELQLIILSMPLLILLKKAFFKAEDSVIIDRSEDGVTKNGPVCLLKITSIRLLRSKAGLVSLAFVLIGFIINFYNVYTNSLPPSWFYTFPDVAQKNYYFGLYLTKTWTHLSVFLIGLLAGNICRSTLQLHNIELLRTRQTRDDEGQSSLQQQQHHQQHPSPEPSRTTNQSINNSGQSHGSTSTIMAMELGSERKEGSLSNSTSGLTVKRRQQLIRVSFQVVALVSMLAMIFSAVTWSTQGNPSALVAALYDTSSRLIWSVSLVGLMTLLCLPDSETQKNSPTARFLSHPICTLLGRLSFLAYLISPYVHTFVLAVEEQSLFPSLFIIFHVIVGNIVITYAVAFILAIVIEQPVRRLVNRFVFGKRFCKQKVNISLCNNKCAP